MELTETAEALAPDVDRLVVAVHRRMPQHLEEISGLLRTSGVPRPVLIVDLRPYLLEGPVPLTVLEAFGRFLPASTVADVLASLEASGTLERRDDVLVSSAGAIRFAEGVSGLQARVVDDLWGSFVGVVQDLLLPAASALAGASAVEANLPLFGSLMRLEEPRLGDSYLLHHRLTGLRYLRTDIHVAVLADVGLAPPGAVIVDELWRGDSSAVAAVDPALLDGGWVDASGTLTDLGRRRRNAIEFATNRRVGAALGGVAPDHLAALCNLLPRLPG